MSSMQPDKAAKNQSTLVAQCLSLQYQPAYGLHAIFKKLKAEEYDGRIKRG
jgi:hypothetical protein